MAGHPGLGHLEQGAADPVAVPDADLVVGEALDGEVLAELAGHEVVAAQLALPVAVGGDVVDVDGAVLATVRDEVGLGVAGDVEPADPPAVADLGLPDRVRTSRPRQSTSRGWPTLTESSRMPAGVPAARPDVTRAGDGRSPRVVGELVHRVAQGRVERA